MKDVTLHLPCNSVSTDHLDYYLRLHQPESEVTLPSPSRSGFERATKCIMHTSIRCPPERTARIKTAHARTRHLRLCHSSKSTHAAFYSSIHSQTRFPKGLKDFFFFFLSLGGSVSVRRFPLSDDESTNRAAAEVKGEITSSASGQDGQLQRKSCRFAFHFSLSSLFFSERE